MDGSKVTMLVLAQICTQSFRFVIAFAKHGYWLGQAQFFKALWGTETASQICPVVSQNSEKPHCITTAKIQQNLVSTTISVFR